MTCNLGYLFDVKNIKFWPLNLPDGKLAYAEKYEKMRLGNLNLTNVLYIPQLTCHLLSILQLLKSNSFMVLFMRSLCAI